MFLNVKGREPQGTIAPEDYEKVRDDLAAALEATLDDEGRTLGTRVFRPGEIYARVEGIAPDLIVHFGDLAWRAVGGVGYGTLHVQENDTGPDDCNHAQFGGFILAGPGIPAAGWREDVRLLDLAPTLLAHARYDVPPSMQGRDLGSGWGLPDTGASAGAFDAMASPPGDGEASVRERLRGLGYLS